MKVHAFVKPITKGKALFLAPIGNLADGHCNLWLTNQMYNVAHFHRNLPNFFGVPNVLINGSALSGHTKLVSRAIGSLVHGSERSSPRMPYINAAIASQCPRASVRS